MYRRQFQAISETKLVKDMQRTVLINLSSLRMSGFLKCFCEFSPQNDHFVKVRDV